MAGRWEPDAHATSVRQTCDYCGSGGLTWAPAASMVNLVELLDGAEFAAEWWAGVVAVGAEPTSSAWRCPQCHNVGIFSEWTRGVA
jgi:hypothetical protein